MSDSLQPHGLYTTWSSPGHNTGVGSLFLLQGIFSTQGLNAGLLHCRQILYQLSHKGSPRILEWIAYPFSSRPYWARNRTEVSCIAGRFITNWAIRGARMLQWVAMPSSWGSSWWNPHLLHWQERCFFFFFFLIENHYHHLASPSWRQGVEAASEGG